MLPLLCECDSVIGLTEHNVLQNFSSQSNHEVLVKTTFETKNVSGLQDDRLK